MNCPACNAAMPAEGGDCVACGHRSERACAGCGVANPAHAKFCLACGLALAAPTLATGGERRVLTVLFCDLVGSTELSSRLDPEDLSPILACYQQSVAALIQGAGGIVARYTGDGILAYFGYPAAREDDSERAIGAALEIARSVGELAGNTVPLRVRIGIATGQVVVAEIVAAPEADRPAIVGDTPNLAARLQALAEPGCIVIAAETRDMAGGLYLYRDLGLRELKGFPGPLRAWEVLGRSAIASRFVALHPTRHPLVGRSDEVELLVRRWRLARGGQGQVVLLTGEPGIGKSRLVATLEERLAGEPHAILHLFCSPQHQNSALYPSMTQLQLAAGFDRADSDAVKMVKLETLLTRWSGVRPGDLQLMAELLGLAGEAATQADPQRRRDATLAALLRQLEGLTQQRPILAVFEDVHWVDPTSLELLDMVVAQVAAWPMLIVVTARTEFQPAWIAEPHVSLVVPRRLGMPEVAQLVAQIGDGRTIPPDVVHHIAARADGIPLFVEELTKAYLDDVARTGDKGGNERLSRAIPTSLQALLLARLDRLGLVKELAQIGSAIGREFSHDLLAAVWARPEDELNRAMAQLSAAGLTVARGTRSGAAYLFRHALIQDAAYASLLRRQRRAIHGRIAEVIEARFPEIVDQQPETIARHCGEAGLADRAMAYWLRAGQRAARRAAVAEAAAHFNKGVDAARLAEASPERARCELELQMGLGPALMALQGYTSVAGMAAFLRARELIDAAHDPAEQVHVLHGLFNVHYGRAELSSALAVAEEANALAGQHEPGLLGAVGQTLCAMGRFVEARDYLQRAIDTFDAAHDAHSGLFGSRIVVAQAFMAKVQFALGYPEQSAALTHAAMRHARASGHAVSVAIAYMGEMFIATESGDAGQAMATTEQALAHASEHDLGNFKLWAAFHRAALSIRDDPRAAIVAMQGVIEEADRMGTRMFRPAQLGYLGAAHASIGAFDEGLAWFDEAFALAEATEGREAVPALYRLRARTLLALRRQELAEDNLGRAILVAQHQSARIEELRAATVLARLRYDQGRSCEARDALAGVYGAMTEGFAFADVLGAKRLLDRLNAWCDRVVFV